MAAMSGDGMSLGATLRVWRDRLSPAAVGLPLGGARRAAGLRREELADLAGVSVDGNDLTKAQPAATRFVISTIPISHK